MQSNTIEILNMPKKEKVGKVNKSVSTFEKCYQTVPMCKKIGRNKTKVRKKHSKVIIFGEKTNLAN